MTARPLLLDASAITAFIRRKEVGQVVLDTITSGGRETLVLAVQIVEVKLVSSGSLTPQQAASFYYARRKPYNLSPGDALCPGAAEALGADVMTTEYGWATLPALPFKVNLIRQAT